MEITRHSSGPCLELALRGRLDATWSEHVGRALAECLQSGEHQILLDMAQVEYLSSAGIRVLLLYSRQLNAIQGRFAITKASPAVRKVLELSGLAQWLAGPSTAAGAPAAALRSEMGAPLQMPEAGATAERFELNAAGKLQVRMEGAAASWLEGKGDPGVSATIQFPSGRIGIGLGRLVSGDDRGTQPFGEFLAAGGVAVAQPADGSNKPDYLLQQAALTPAVNVAYGLTGEGQFQCLVRFDKGPEQISLPLSSVVSTCLDATGGDAVGLVMVAETAALVGAALQKSPGVAPDSSMLFSFPEIRDWISFTAEPAFANSTCLLVGFAARGPAIGRVQLLKPMIASGLLHGHVHAAAFAYRPLRKGRAGLSESVERLFESEQVLGLLHLLNDWRRPAGTGESRLLRGACWCAPVMLPGGMDVSANTTPIQHQPPSHP